MSNVTFNDIPMMEYLSQSEIKQSPLKIVIKDVFELTKEDAGYLSSLIDGINEMNLSEKPKQILFKSACNILKRRKVK